MPRQPNLHELHRLSAAERRRLLTRVEAGLSLFIDKVRPVIAAVERDGDVALARLAAEFDGARVDRHRLMASAEEFAAAEASLDPDIAAALRFAADAVRRFHQRQLPELAWMHEMAPGVMAGERTRPIASVACYVPRGKGSFPSAALMTAIPAAVAGVRDIIILTPPGPDGSIDAATLFAARLAGVERVFRVGGAQAIAAAAFGTQSIPRCAKIVGPGSPWVAAAKRALAHVIDTGSPAGPSEIIVLADPAANGRLAALDLLIEAEHGEDSSAYLVTWSGAVAAAALAAIPEHWRAMNAQRVAFSSAVLAGPAGGVVLALDEDEAVAFVNDYAPEHLAILAADPRALAERIENAGEILLGTRTPSTLANFVIGPSHVLPTGGWARTFSPLSVHDFLKRTSIAEVSAHGYPELARHAGVIATYEGFDAHANAVGPMREKIIEG